MSARQQRALQLLLQSNTDVVWIRVLTVQRVSPYVHVCSSDLGPTAQKKKAKIFHLPVLHGSGVERQSHAALQEDRGEKNTRVRIPDASLESFALALLVEVFQRRTFARGVKSGTPSIALLHKEVSGIQRHT